MISHNQWDLRRLRENHLFFPKWASRSKPSIGTHDRNQGQLLVSGETCICLRKIATFSRTSDQVTIVRLFDRYHLETDEIPLI